MTDQQKIKLADELLKYCKKFNISLDYLFAILEDQKVTPMIRGKAMEYNAFLLLEGGLSKVEWSVEKLNLSAQPGIHDEDISVTHKRTGIRLKVESKSAVRGSFNVGKKTKKLKVPHFMVKCHRSRSNMKLAKTSNDRYSVNAFDIILTNTVNSIFQKGTISAHLEVLHKEEFKNFLYLFYHVENDLDLIAKCESDWRFCVPKDIAESGFIPRTPYVKLENDLNWRPLSEIEERLLQVVEEKRKSNRSPKHR
jgi:hypothetical protein